MIGLAIPLWRENLEYFRKFTCYQSVFENVYVNLKWRSVGSTKLKKESYLELFVCKDPCTVSLSLIPFRFLALIVHYVMCN